VSLFQGLAYKGLEQWQQAKEYLDDFINKARSAEKFYSPDLPTFQGYHAAMGKAYVNRGQVLCELGQYELAVLDFANAAAHEKNTGQDSCYVTACVFNYLARQQLVNTIDSQYVLSDFDGYDGLPAKSDLTPALMAQIMQETACLSEKQGSVT
jgi:tetratricopeptide (TPR) repeat protein